MNNILDFIKRRFPTDCNWTSGNCYYFANILKLRFTEGEIWYDLIEDHFVFKYENEFYDWTGILSNYKFRNSSLIKWNYYNETDPLHYARIVRDDIL